MSFMSTLSQITASLQMNSQQGVSSSLLHKTQTEMISFHSRNVAGDEVCQRYEGKISNLSLVI